MNAWTVWFGCLALGASAPASVSREDGPGLSDAVGDASIRRTDFGADGAVGKDGGLADVVDVRLRGWSPTNPPADPYAGVEVDGTTAHIFRLDVRFVGLVNPAGTMGDGGTWREPFQFGPSPVYGFIEIDVDDDSDTGGDLPAGATVHYLANVGRFGALPEGSRGGRAARSGAGHDWDYLFDTAPQMERSGADFAVVLCGCSAVTVVSEGGDADGTFEAGETWIVRGRYFQRVSGYQGASAVVGGSQPQAYDPVVNLRFSHDLQSNLTTVTLVYALDMAGAAALRGQPEQQIDQVIDIGGNHSSVAEALQDVIWGAEGFNSGPLTEPARTFAIRWAGRTPALGLDVRRWRVSAIFGTPYVDQADGYFAWTDVGFDALVGDLNSDHVVDSLDAALFDSTLAGMDGSSSDADGAVDGMVVVPSRGPNFSVMDFNNDGVVNSADRAVIVPPPPPCPVDWNHDGAVNSQDYFAFLDAFFIGNADFNHDSVTNSQDLFDFMAMFLAGCP